MPPILYAHPFSSYCWKVLIALWERGVPFDYRRIDDPAHAAAFAAIAPTGKIPVLVDGGVAIPESTIIIEHLDLHHGAAPPMIPRDPRAALEVRLLDRMADNHLMGPMQAIVGDALRPAGSRDPYGVAQAGAALARAYGWWDARLAGRDWAAGAFGLADCAAAPALFYADWVHPIADAHRHLRAYRARLLARPAIARAVDEARPFRGGFPLGDPGRD